jgi:Xaa-Pro aminopeptidase
MVGIESVHISVGELEQIGAVLPDCTFQSADKVIDVIAAVKDPEEIEAIRQAIAISEQAFTDVMGIITEGVTERDLAAELTYRQMKMGADKDSFDIIVASGPRGALPHGTASHKKIEAGELIVFDWGCFVGGYPSDITRMVVLGKANDRMREIHRIVFDAQQLALDAVKTGITVSELDRIARDYITEQGFGKEFGHPLGHGLGVDIHSYPRVSQQVDYPLPTDAVITIEPGIYIPGWGGVRIEENVRVTDNGADILTSLSRDLIEIEHT